MKPELIIGTRRISEDEQPFVIAEIGINHEGSVQKAKQMIDDAHTAGAECVKFQRHVLEDEMSKEARKVIPGNADESIWDIMERCALTLEDHKELKEYTESKGMIYLCTPFSRAAADELESIGVAAYKIGSGECNNYPLIKHVASFGKPMFLSTGMNNLDSIAKSVAIIEEAGVPYAVFQCTSMYPTPYENVNLASLKQLREHFPNAVLGLSDHSLGIYTCLGAVMLGAAILEKHYTSDKSWPGPDVSISIDPEELKELIVGSDAVHKARDGTKQVLKEEQPTIDFAYATVVATQDIKKGELLTEDNIWVKRPGTGEILAEHYESLIGAEALDDIEKDDHLTWSHVKE